MAKSSRDEKVAATCRGRKRNSDVRSREDTEDSGEEAETDGEEDMKEAETHTEDDMDSDAILEFDANNTPEADSDDDDSDHEFIQTPLMLREAAVSDATKRKAKKKCRQSSKEVSDPGHAEFLKLQREAAQRKAAEEAAEKRGETEVLHK